VFKLRLRLVTAEHNWAYFLHGVDEEEALLSPAIASLRWWSCAERTATDLLHKYVKVGTRILATDAIVGGYFCPGGK
jgi:hypothetical protein